MQGLCTQNLTFEGYRCDGDRHAKRVRTDRAHVQVVRLIGDPVASFDEIFGFSSLRSHIVGEVPGQSNVEHIAQVALCKKKV